MRKSFEDYTEEERAIINDLTKRDYADMTKEEVLLFAEWESTKTYIDADFETRRQAMEKESMAKIELARETEKAALDTLKEMAETAKARLKAVEDGQAEQK